MVIGQKEIEKNIDKAVKIVSKSIEEGLIESGERGVNILKKNSPVVSGRLRGSMSYTIDKKIYSPLKNSKNKSTDTVKKTQDKDTVYIGTNVEYAQKVEYLSKTGSKGFMHRSYQILKGIVKKIVAKNIKEGIK